MYGMQLQERGKIKFIIQFMYEQNVLLLYRSELVSATSRSADVLALPDSGAGKGIPVQPLLDAQTAHRDSARSLPHRASDQNLVPEPTDEGEEREDTDHGVERAGKLDVVMATPAAAAAAAASAVHSNAAGCFRCWRCSRSLIMMRSLFVVMCVHFGGVNFIRKHACRC